MGQTTKLLIQRLWDRKSKRRALLILLLSDICLFSVGSYLIVTWVQMKKHPTAPPQIHSLDGATKESRNSTDSNLKQPATQDTPSQNETQTPSRRTKQNPPTKKEKGDPPKTTSPETQPSPTSREGSPSPRNGVASTNDADKNGAATENNRHNEPVKGNPPDDTKDSKENRQKQQNFLFAVRGALRKKNHSFKQCYTEAMKLHGKRLSGSLQLKFQLKDSGEVESVTTVKNTTGSSTLKKCLLSVTKRIRFPKPPKGVKEFLYPLSFSAQR